MRLKSIDNRKEKGPIAWVLGVLFILAPTSAFAGTTTVDGTSSADVIWIGNLRFSTNASLACTGTDAGPYKFVNGAASQLRHTVVDTNLFTNGDFLTVNGLQGNDNIRFANATSGNLFIGLIGSVWGCLVPLAVTAGSIGINGGAGDDVIVGSDQRDKIYGDEGDDFINSAGEDDEICGGVSVSQVDCGTGDNGCLHDTDQCLGGDEDDLILCAIVDGGNDDLGDDCGWKTSGSATACEGGDKCPDT